MKGSTRWDDLACFCVVARLGNLSHAARQIDSSAATLGRRMKALEARLGKRLFLHGAEGYVPTPDGRALLERLAPMERAAADLAHWQGKGDGPVRVRISAGSWTSLFLAENLSAFWNPEAPFVPEFLFCNLDMDIARREVDIGLRNRRPDRPWLAGRRNATLDYAIYARSSGITGFIGAAQDAAQTPSARWVQAHHGTELNTTVNDPRLALALAEGGAGRVVLPAFIGEARPKLVRLSGPIETLRSEEWLVSHHEARHEPAIRATLDALGALLSGDTRPCIC